MDITALKEKANLLRKEIIHDVSLNGGYLSSNLSCVEICISLHNYLNSADKVFFSSEDLCKTYDLLTNKKSEVCSLSSLLASCITRDLNHDQYKIVMVLNSSYIRSGKDLEALSEISKLDSQLLIIFNDDTMISQGIGIMDKVISNLRNTKTYNNLKDKAKDVLRPSRYGDKFIEDIHNFKSDIRKTIMDEGIFGTYNIDYQGPIDGNSFLELTRCLEISNTKNYPSVIHCISQSGKGYQFAEACTTDYWYKVNPFNIETGKPVVNEIEGYKFIKHIIADELAKKMLDNKNIIVLSCDRLIYDGVSAIFSHFPQTSIRTSNIENQFNMAIQFSKEGKLPYFNIKASELDNLYRFFKSNTHSMIIGLNNDNQDLSYLKELEHINIIYCNEYNDIISHLNDAMNNNLVNIFVYEEKIIKIA